MCEGDKLQVQTNSSNVTLTVYECLKKDDPANKHIITVLTYIYKYLYIYIYIHAKIQKKSESYYRNNSNNVMSVLSSYNSLLVLTYFRIYFVLVLLRNTFTNKKYYP